MEIINLDMTPSTVTPNAHAGQYDSARTVRFMLKNGGTPYTLAGTETITTEITRSDNTEVTVNVANTSSNYVDVVFDDTVCTVKGLYACELRIVDGGVDIGSKNFALLVQRDPYDGAGVHVETVGPADICTFETTLAEPLQSVKCEINATGGNGTPSTPIPIVGYSEANITRCGVNLWDEEWEVSGTGIASTNYIPVRPNTAYYFKIPTGWLTVTEYDIDKNVITTYSVVNNTKTLGPNCYFIKFVASTAYGTTYNNDISINYPSTDTTYHAYNGDTVTIAFGQTVYGGVLGVTRGKLSVTHGYLDLGSILWFAANADGRANSRESIAKSITSATVTPDLLCTSYPTITAKEWYQFATEGITVCGVGYGSNGTIGVYSSTFANYTADQVKTTLSGVYICYELATPFDIDLTPEVVSAIVGTNNIFADCGETTVKYLTVE